MTRFVAGDRDLELQPRLKRMSAAVPPPHTGGVLADPFGNEGKKGSR